MRKVLVSLELSVWGEADEITDAAINGRDNLEEKIREKLENGGLENSDIRIEATG